MKNNCSKCKVEFSNDTPLLSKGMCKKCYYKNNYHKNKNKVNSYNRYDNTNCLTCNLEFGSKNYKDRLVRKAAKGICSICYNKEYFKSGSFICKGCKCKMPHKIIGICKYCKEKDMEEIIKRKYKKQLKGDVVGKVKYTKVTITKEHIEEMKRLFNRYKLGYNRPIDSFLVLQLYLDIFDNPTDLDSYEVDSQIIIMLRKLKDVYDSKSKEVYIQVDEPIINVVSKTCYECKEHKPITDFHKRNNAHDKRAYNCKVCIKKYSDLRKEKIKNELLEKW